MVTGGTSWKKSIEIMSGHFHFYQLVRNTPIWASLFPLLFVFSVQEALMLNGVGRRLSVDGILWEGAERDLRGSSGSFGRGLRRGLGRVSSSRAIQTAHWGREAAGGSVHLSLHLKNILCECTKQNCSLEKTKKWTIKKILNGCIWKLGVLCDIVKSPNKNI